MRKRISYSFASHFAIPSIVGKLHENLDDAQIHEFHRIQQKVLDKENSSHLSNEGEISAKVLRRLEYELDLEETRLILERVEQ